MGREDTVRARLNTGALEQDIGESQFCFAAKQRSQVPA